MNLQEKLTKILSDRDELVNLYHQRRIARSRADIHSRRGVELEIAAIVLEPLGLSRREAPGYPLVAEAAVALLETGDWSFVHPAGSSVDHWPARLRERLLAVCGPLDPVIKELLAEETHEAVA